QESSMARDHRGPPATPSWRYLPGGVYSSLLLAAMASTSSTVSSGTVVIATRPVADTVMASVAAALLSGRSQTTNASSSPNAKWNDSIEPPTCLATASAAARRAEPPSFITPCRPSPEYRTLSRYFGISVPPSIGPPAPVARDARAAWPRRQGVAQDCSSPP